MPCAFLNYNNFNIACQGDFVFKCIVRSVFIIGLPVIAGKGQGIINKSN
jgi:hypothetical protein